MELAAEASNSRPNPNGGVEIDLNAGPFSVSAQPPAAPVAPTSSPPESVRGSPLSVVSALNALAAATRSESVGLSASGAFDQPDLSASGNAAGLSGFGFGLEAGLQGPAPERRPSAGSSLKAGGAGSVRGGVDLKLQPSEPQYMNLGGVSVSAPNAEAQPQAPVASEAPSGPYANLATMNAELSPMNFQSSPMPNASLSGGVGGDSRRGSRTGSQLNLNLQAPQLQSQVTLQAPAASMEVQADSSQALQLNGHMDLQQPQLNGTPKVSAQLNASQLNAQLVNAQLNAPQVQLQASAAKAKERQSQSTEKKKGKMLGIFSRKHKDKGNAKMSSPILSAGAGVSAPSIALGVNANAPAPAVRVGGGLNGQAAVEAVGPNGQAGTGAGAGVPPLSPGVELIANGTSGVGAAPRTPVVMNMSTFSGGLGVPSTGVDLSVVEPPPRGFTGSLRGLNMPSTTTVLPQVDAHAGTCTVVFTYSPMCTVAVLCVRGRVQCSTVLYNADAPELYTIGIFGVRPRTLRPFFIIDTKIACIVRCVYMPSIGGTPLWALQLLFSCVRSVLATFYKLLAFSQY